MSRHMKRKRNDPFDFYETPSWATEALLERESFEGLSLEPCAGHGAISKVFEAHGLSIESSDVRTCEQIHGMKGQDFLRRETPVDNIITNPPFNQAEEMVFHSLKLARNKVAFLLKITFLEGQGRYNLFMSTPLKKVYVFSKRIQMFPGNDPDVNKKDFGMICFAWFVWEKGYIGPPTLDWILDEAATPQIGLPLEEAA